MSLKLQICNIQRKMFESLIVRPVENSLSTSNRASKYFRNFTPVVKNKIGFAVLVPSGQLAQTVRVCIPSKSALSFQSKLYEIEQSKIKRGHFKENANVEIIFIHWFGPKLELVKSCKSAKCLSCIVIIIAIKLKSILRHLHFFFQLTFTNGLF